jgi:lipopolysaccharide exporter
MPYRRKLSALQTLFSQGPLQPGGFFRNVLALTTGTALSQAIMLAALPLLTRLYTPSDFGVLAQFTVLSTILSTVACLGYEPAIVLPKRDRTALSLWVLCLVTGVLVSGLCWLVLALWPHEIASLMGNPELETWLNLIPLTLFIWAITVAATQWCTRQRQFAAVSTGMVWNRLTTVGSQSLLGIIPSVTGVAGLLAGFIVGSVYGLGVLLHKSRKNLRSADWQQLRLKRILMLAWYYRDFPGFGLASNLIGAVVRALPVFSLGYFFTPAAVGFFALANQLVAGPVQLVTNSIVDVFFERANRAKTEGTLPQLTASVYGTLISVLLTPLTLLSIAAPEITVLVLGEEWVQTGIFIRWMAIWFFFLSSITPMFRIFLVLNRQNELAAVNVISLIVGVITLYLGGTYGDATQTIILFCIGSALVRTGEALRVMYISDNSMRLVAELPFREVMKSAPLILPLLIVRFVTNDEYIISGLFLLLLGIFGLTRLKSIVRPAA